MSAMLDVMTNEAKGFEESYSQILDEVKEYYAAEYGDAKTLESTDTWAIGKYTKTVETYAPYMEASDVTGLGSIGDALRDNLGLTATQYATSIVPLIATVQPTEQELAVIYYKRALAVTSRGNIVEGQEVQSKFGKVSEDLDGYISDEQSSSSVIVDDGNGDLTGAYIIKLTGPVRRGTIAVNIAGGTVTGIDDGEGKIYGGNIDPDASGINYETGVLTIKLLDNSTLAAGDPIDVIFTQLVFQNDSISGFKYDITPEAIPVNYYPLQITYDVVNDFVTKRQFGTAISEFANKDLVYQINKAISSKLIKQLRVTALKNDVVLGGGATWSKVPPAGTSLIEHRRTFTDIYEIGISRMEDMTGLGGISAVVVGQEGRKIYQALGVGQAKSKPGAYVLGFQDGAVIIYAPSEVLPKNEVLLVHKGDFFETAAIYAPFLPVMAVKTQGRDHNVFQNSVGAATGAGMKIVNDGFVQKITLTDD